MTKHIHVYKFAVVEHGMSEMDALTFESIYEDHEPNYRYIAQDAARVYFHKNDGWEATWPLTFHLWTEDGKSIGEWEVEMEAEPVFFATKKEEGERKP